MGRQIIRQPNGLLAEFSTVVEAFVFYDATPHELAQEAADEARRLAYEEAFAAATRAQQTGSSCATQFRLTWDQAYASHLAHGGEPIDVSA